MPIVDEPSAPTKPLIFSASVTNGPDRGVVPEAVETMPVESSTPSITPETGP
jgi:hypothetical protein